MERPWQPQPLWLIRHWLSVQRAEEIVLTKGILLIACLAVTFLYEDDLFLSDELTAASKLTREP